MAAQADTVGPSVEEAPPKLVETPVETVAEVRTHHVHDLYTMYVRAHHVTRACALKYMYVCC